MSEIAVEAEDLTRRFGEFVAVDSVSFRVEESEVFGFLGPNGAGKTTTIKMLAGLLAPSEGRGMVAGHDVATESEAIKASIGYMSQLFSLYTDLTVEENIHFFGGLYGVTGDRLKERKAWVLEMARLGDHRRRLVRDLPLGFKQRLALGSAVLHEPPVLFLDEPTSGVDPLSRRSFWDLIYDLAEAGTTVFVTTHYMEEAEYCNRLALMNRGKLVALDAPGALRRSLEHPVLEIVADRGPAAAEILADSEEVLTAGLVGRTVHAAVRGAEEGERRVRRLLEEEGIEIREIREVTPSLEDVFVSLVAAAGGAAEG